MFIYWWSNTWILASNERILNIKPMRSSLDLLNYSSNRLEHSFFKHQTNSNVTVYWWSKSNTLILASNDRISKSEHCSTHHYYSYKFLTLFSYYKLAIVGLFSHEPSTPLFAIVTVLTAEKKWKRGELIKPDDCFR